MYSLQKKGDDCILKLGTGYSPEVSYKRSGFSTLSSHVLREPDTESDCVNKLEGGYNKRVGSKIIDLRGNNPGTII